jgi:hypothetical protein
LTQIPFVAKEGEPLQGNRGLSDISKLKEANMFRKVFMFAMLLALLVGAVLAGGGNNPVVWVIGALTALAFQVERRRGWQ